MNEGSHLAFSSKMYIFPSKMRYMLEFEPA